MSVQEITACDLGDAAWLWTHGHVDKRRFKGECIAKAKQGYFDSFDPFDRGYMDVVKGKVKHGWVLTTDGGDVHCGPELVTWFSEEPIPEGVRTWGVAEDPDDGEEIEREIVDGPHPATWLEVVW